MKLTVLQSVYKKDNPQYLQECFESLARQTLPADKIVLVKDGSLTLELEEVIRLWQVKLPLRVVGYEKNEGLAYALNYGLQYVDTELVARMDSDDICYPDRFKKQVEWFKLNPHCCVLGTGIEEFYQYDSDPIFRRIRLYPKVTTRQNTILYKGTPIAHPTVMIKTSVLKKFLYNTDTKCNEDIELWFRLLKDDIVFFTLQEPLLRFRITDTTLERRSKVKAWNEFYIYFSSLIKLNGFSIRLIFPLLRFFTRLLPTRVIKFLYFSNMRTSFFER